MVLYILLFVSGLCIGGLIAFGITFYKMRKIINTERAAKEIIKKLADELDEGRCKRITQLMLQIKELEARLSSR